MAVGPAASAATPCWPLPAFAGEKPASADARAAEKLLAPRSAALAPSRVVDLGRSAPAEDGPARVGTEWFFGMEFDIFFSICQTEVHGYMPSERVMFENFFEQIALADHLGFGTAWVAESHLSTEIQEDESGRGHPALQGRDWLEHRHSAVVTPHLCAHEAARDWLGDHEHSLQRRTDRRGGADQTFLTLHGLDPAEKRLLTIGFASGRFPFINVPYGIVPRNAVEKAAWPVVKNKIFEEATEIFLRLLKGETLSSESIQRRSLKRQDFRTDADWQKVTAAAALRSGTSAEQIPLEPRWQFPKLRIVPQEARMELLRLAIGSHDPATQILANTLMPVGVFNLSITPGDEIEKTNARMLEHYHPAGGG